MFDIYEKTSYNSINVDGQRISLRFRTTAKLCGGQIICRLVFDPRRKQALTEKKLSSVSRNTGRQNRKKIYKKLGSDND